MTIETGSQNASRIEGVYAYPINTYNTAPIESVSPVEAKVYSFSRKEKLAKIDEKEKNELDYIKSKAIDKDIFQNGNLYKGNIVDITA